MELKIEYIMGQCNQFRRDGQGGAEEVSVVVSPLKVLEEGDKVRIISGCNMFRSCHNADCWYSADGRKGKDLT